MVRVASLLTPQNRAQHDPGVCIENKSTTYSALPKFGICAAFVNIYFQLEISDELSIEESSVAQSRGKP